MEVKQSFHLRMANIQVSLNQVRQLHFGRSIGSLQVKQCKTVIRFLTQHSRRIEEVELYVKVY